jgi:hypothetical protein
MVGTAQVWAGNQAAGVNTVQLDTDQGAPADNQREVVDTIVDEEAVLGVLLAAGHEGAGG